VSGADRAEKWAIMSRSRRGVLIAAFVAASCLAVYPPWVRRWDAHRLPMSESGPFQRKGAGPPVAGAEPLGHHFLFHPPKGSGLDYVSVDFGRLFLYWAATGGMTAVFLLLFRGE